MKSLTAVALLALASGVVAEKPSEVPYYGRSPPVYPTPPGNGNSSRAWTNAYRKAVTLVSKMTLEEKVNVTRGFPGQCVGNSGAVPRLGVAPICFADGPAGLRGQEFVSAFPAGIHLAATFDAELMYDYGLALGREFRDRGVHMALGPVSGPLGRIARAGRNWEGLSNDPYLAGVGMGQVTRGMQDSGVVATPKHWLLNEQEFRRRESALGEAVSSNVDDRTIHELYVWPFMDSLAHGAGSVMCSYQRANHSYGCQNSKLLNGILKTELGFEGFVVSDWEAQMGGVASANAGMDVVMPRGGFWGDNLTEAVKNGSVSTTRLDDMATRLFAAMYHLGQEHDYPQPGIWNNRQKHFRVDAQRDHAKLIRKIGAAGTVLVKNVNKTLPLKDPRFLAIYGYDATVKASPWANRDRYGGGYEVNFGWETFNGTLITAGGSGGNTPPYVVSPFQAIQERISASAGVLRWDFYSESPASYYDNAEACLVFINSYASESFDRLGLADGHSDRLVNNIANNCASTIVVVHSAGIRTVDAWVDHPNVTAVIFGGLPGQESGHALADVLWGDVNPAGRLPYTIARREEDYGKLLNSSIKFDFFPDDDFEEGLYIDYRAFDRDGIEPRFAFGFGLSYTDFAYNGLKTAVVPTPEGAVPAELPDPAVRVVQGGHPELWDTVATVRATVRNSGGVEGIETAQLYVGVPGGDSPARQLRGIRRVGPLSPGEARPITFELTRRDLSVWDVVAQQWRVRRGEYKIYVGASSRDLRLNGTLVI
ncbi:hypothetical protein GGTG_03156 [Gaeumannomyces tritici R3-111a-1]|uniref:beta-glucosidase n=1 Tax=Gaeumannomyces tritici (strain R3-111a-1) TaxID=644352 RepID=J3NPE8_GAET3|nr:hypothetical protein GGTG_03156 [Gaeumannomyces tritici R3-111a-1]EJT78053.1 hypothetical protein GGTG_03156 [Gaeumannomyces tritici R3-111a-1]